MTWTKINALPNNALHTYNHLHKKNNSLSPAPYKINIANMFAILFSCLYVNLVHAEITTFLVALFWSPPTRTENIYKYKIIHNNLWISDNFIHQLFHAEQQTQSCTTERGEKKNLW